MKKQYDRILTWITTQIGMWFEGLKGHAGESVVVGKVYYRNRTATRELRRVIKALKRDYVVFERGAKTCGFDERAFAFRSRFDGEVRTVEQYCEAEPQLHEILKKIEHFQSALNDLDSHPDFKLMRSAAKRARHSAAVQQHVTA